MGNPIMRSNQDVKIIFGGTEIPVIRAVPRYMDGKQKVVFEVKAREENVTEAELKKLKTNTAPIECYCRNVIIDDETGGVLETGEWELKDTYDGYDSGEYASSYENGVYTCWVTRKGETERAVDRLGEEMRRHEADVAYISVMTGVAL